MATVGLFEILVVFYLYLLVRPSHVRRAPMYLLGVAGLLLAVLGRLILAFSPRTLGFVGVLEGIGELAGLLFAVLCCYGGWMPQGLSDVVQKASGAGQTPPGGNAPSA